MRVRGRSGLGRSSWTGARGGRGTGRVLVGGGRDGLGAARAVPGEVEGEEERACEGDGMGRDAAGEGAVGAALRDAVRMGVVATLPRRKMMVQYSIQGGTVPVFPAWICRGEVAALFEI
jgi:hypothetical protein